MLSDEKRASLHYGFSFDNPFNHHPISSEEWMINKEESTEDFLLIQGYDANLYPTPDLGSGDRSKFWYDYTINRAIDYLKRIDFHGTVQLDDVLVMEDGKILVEDHYDRLSKLIDPLYHKDAIAHVAHLIEQASVMNPLTPNELYLNVSIINWQHKFPQRMSRNKNEDYHTIYEILSDLESAGGYLKRPTIVSPDHKIVNNLPSFLAALVSGHKRVWVKYQDESGKMNNMLKGYVKKRHRNFDWDGEDKRYDLR